MYLYYKLNVKHLAVVFHPDEYGSNYVVGLQLAAKDLTPDMVVEAIETPLRSDRNDERVPGDIQRAVAFLKETRYTYFFSLFGLYNHDRLMEEAFHQGIAGTGLHNWFVAESVADTWVTRRTFPKGSPLHLAHVGLSRFSAVGGVRGISKGFDTLESLLRAFKNPSDIGFLRKVLPKYESHNDTIFDEVLNSEAFLQTAVHPSAFAYDAAIALGLAACNATQPDTYFAGLGLYSVLKTTAFDGATGRVVFDAETGSRLPQSMSFELINHQLDPSRETADDVGFKLVRTAIFQEGEWEVMEPTVFNDGTTNIAPDLPELAVNANLLTPGLRAGGLFMCAATLLVAMYCAYWTQANTSSLAVKASQPIFLHLICAGAFILSLSIIPLSIDPGIASDQANDIACLAFPWLAVSGFSLMMAALWAKTARIHRVLKSGMTFRRVIVTAVDVFRPMLAILGGTCYC